MQFSLSLFYPIKHVWPKERGSVGFSDFPVKVMFSGYDRKKVNNYKDLLYDRDLHMEEFNVDASITNKTFKKMHFHPRQGSNPFFRSLRTETASH